MLDCTGESWRPPLHAPVKGGLSRVLAAMRRFLDLQAGSIWRDLRQELGAARGTVLDVGCGAQPYRALLGPAARYMGIDTDQAKAHFGYEMPDTSYFAGDVWPVADATVDLVLCTETIEHVPDTRQFLSEAARVARPGATLLLTVPFAARWHFIPHDYWRFTPSGLRLVVEATGFGDVRVMARGNPTTVACYKTMALILPLLFAPGQTRAVTILKRLLGVVFVPCLLILAGIANLSLLGAGGDDCLGYTVIATRRPS